MVLLTAALGTSLLRTVVLRSFYAQHLVDPASVLRCNLWVWLFYAGSRQKYIWGDRVGENPIGRPGYPGHVVLSELKFSVTDVY